jgi:DNA invertase Pin-like site-specific DNA recombinase
LPALIEKLRIYVFDGLKSIGMVMKADWLLDARKIPNEVMNYIRRLAVRAVEEKHQSPELIAEIFDISRSSVYKWLRRYREEGEEALDSGSAPGAPAVITAEMDCCGTRC